MKASGTCHEDSHAEPIRRLPLVNVDNAGGGNATALNRCAGRVVCRSPNKPVHVFSRFEADLLLCTDRSTPSVPGLHHLKSELADLERKLRNPADFTSPESSSKGSARSPSKFPSAPPWPRSPAKGGDLVPHQSDRDALSPTTNPGMSLPELYQALSTLHQVICTRRPEDIDAILSV